MLIHSIVPLILKVENLLGSTKRISFLSFQMVSFKIIFFLNFYFSFLDYISQFEGKKLDSFCRDVKGLLRDLLPGRTCNCDASGSCRGDECRSSLCKEKMCKGQEKDTNCHDNTDCDMGLYCRESK